jgi:Skp family chaperone for outer membrane proteins
MKRLFLIYAALTFVTISVLGQTRPQTSPSRPTPTPAPRPAATPAASIAPVPDSRIALIDTTMFGDEKNGIWRYVDAAKSVQAEFKTRTDELQSIQNRLEALATEIQTLMKAPVPDQKTIQAKQQQGVSLQNEGKTKKDRLDEDISKRYEQVIAPISSQIGAAMDQFARQRGVTMTLDASKILPAILTALPTTDLTQAFINEFNSKNPRTGSANPTPRP